MLFRSVDMYACLEEYEADKLSFVDNSICTDSPSSPLSPEELFSLSTAVTSTTFVSPSENLNLIIRRPVSDYQSFFQFPIQSFRSVLTGGGLKRVYSIMSVNVIGFFSLRTQQFANSDMVRDWITDENGNVPLIENVITSSDKDCIQAFTSNRVEITKIRLQTQLLKPMERRKMGRMDFKVLQRRSFLFLLRNIPCFLFFLPLNRTLVDYLTPNDGTCPLMGFFLAGYGAGMASVFMMTPIDSVITRARANSGFNATISLNKMPKTTLKGIRSLYRGASTRMCIQAPMFAVMTTAFELRSRHLASK